MGGHLLMSRKELKRKFILELVANKDITLRNLPSGTYFVRLETSGKLETIRMSLIRRRENNRSPPAATSPLVCRMG